METSLLRVRDAALFLNVSQRTVWRMLDSGELTKIRVGGKLVRVEHAELDAIISSQRGGIHDAR